MTSAVRLLLVGVRTHLTLLVASRISVVIALLTPVVYLLVGSLLYRSGGQTSQVVSVGVAAGVIGIWSAVLSDSGTAVHAQRWMGTLELLMISPAPFLLVLAPLVLAPMLVGIASLLVALLCSALFFHATVPASAALPFAGSVLVCALAIATMGLIMAVTFVLFRNPYAVVNAIEIPVWILSGMMVPLGVLPGWAQAVSSVLPSRWGTEVLGDTVAGSPLLTAMLATVGVGLAYVLASAVIIRYVGRRARAQGRLTFA
jgi:ABC-2 type transport system permease protein